MTFRDSLCFVLMGLLLPALYFAFTDRPWPLVCWLTVWIAATISPRNR